MKRLSMILVVLFTAVSLFAGGKECEARKASAKSVELTGTISRADAEAKPVFHVANSDRAYTVCEQTKGAVLKLANDGRSTLRVKGKVVHCGEGEELLIEQANKI